MKRAVVVLPVLLVCCQRPTPAASADPVALQTIAEPAREPVAEPATDAAPEPVPNDVTFELNEGEKREIAPGVELAFESLGHKHRVDGGSVAMWDLVIRGEDVEPVEISETGTDLFVEAPVAARVIVLRGEYEPIRVRVVPATEPIDVETAKALAAKAAGEAGCVLGNQTGYSERNGAFDISFSDGKTFCPVKVGAYTKEVVVGEPHVIDDPFGKPKHKR